MMYADDIRYEKQFDAIRQTAFQDFKFNPDTRHKTEEAELIEEFKTELNRERTGTKWEPLTFIAVRTKLAAIANDADELRRFLSECRDYKNRNGSFGKLFFAKLRK